MYYIIAQVCQKWSGHINKEFFEKVNFKWINKEFKVNEWSDENNSKYRIPFSIVQCFDCGRQYKIEKAKRGPRRNTCRTTGVYLDLKAPISFYCQNCDPHHFYLSLCDEWQEEGVSDDQIFNDLRFCFLHHHIFCLFIHLDQLLVFSSSVVKT